MTLNQLEKNMGFSYIDELLENEKTEKALMFYLGVQNDLPYTSKSAIEFDSSIDRASAEKCLYNLSNQGIINMFDEEDYYLNSNHKEKEKVVSYLATKGYIVQPIVARPIFVQQIRLIERRNE
jgi:hypothetical protein